MATAEAGGPLTAKAVAALGRLGQALGCSRCHHLLEKPVNLGNCEHVFCLACVGDCVGTACPVCHIPSRVQDVKVSRQLDNIATLYRKLQKLQSGDVSGKGNEGGAAYKGAILERGLSARSRTFLTVKYEWLIP
ncbi:BRCA1-associated RING domain protein 1 [Heteronotia binoei]|uniref:BRCA1-associated RING domain protein 1 n=1 Tax=Heteronotia binoei TaxID=13085 RepID=UPI00292E77A5|nr:BRCA1-associated RING domain protein 1 [Heteronotia binoei]